MTITAIPASSKIGHGEAAGCFHEHRPVDFWSIGAEAGTIAWIDLQGNGWTGDPPRQPYAPMGRRLLSDVPPFPPDADLPGWDRWAATVREQITATALNGTQERLEGIA